MRKLTKKYILLFTLFFAFFGSSCEKVIELNLDQTAPKIVIEGIFTDLDVKHLVSISYTKNFDAVNKKVSVSGALVVLMQENGPTITFLEEKKTGNYYSNRFKGIPGKKYTLTVISNGQKYTAISTMPAVVPIDSLNQIELSFFGETRKLVQVNYKDPSGVENFYYKRIFVNGFKKANFNVESDRFNDGKDVKNTVFVSDPELKVGDIVKIQFLTIDENIFKYLFSISQISGNGGPPTTPANPTSNFSNGALGYFSASTLSTDSLIIK